MRLNILPSDKILVVAPHPDDESIGCGGLLSLYGRQCDVLLITNGCDKNQRNLKEIVEVREKEFINAISSARVNAYKILHIFQGDILSSKKQIRDVITEQYDYVFVPNQYDAHRDHVAVYKTLKNLIKRGYMKSTLYEYEVWTPIREPNVYLDIERVIESKKNMIIKHRSQIAELDYVNMIVGLNSYRGNSHNMKYAEAYYCKSAKRAEKIRRIKRGIKSFINTK